MNYRLLILLLLTGCSTDPVTIADRMHYEQQICAVRAPDVAKDACVNRVEDERDKKAGIIPGILSGIATAVGSVMVLAP